MFLSDTEIAERLKRGDLAIDPPPDEVQQGPFSVDLRLGTQFQRFPLARGAAVVDLADPLASVFSRQFSQPETVSLGEQFALSPGTTVLALTLEYVQLPQDLAGLLFPRSAWERLGLSVAAGTIDPGFLGKLTLVVGNSNSLPLVLRPGLRIIRLCLAPVSHVSSRRNAFTGPSFEAEIGSLKATLQRVAPRRARAAVSAESSATRLAAVLTAKGPAKGKALEELMAELFTGLDGLRILRRNARLRAEELDLVIKSDLTTGFWRVAGSPLIVECKNWSGQVGAREISVLVDKLQALSPDSRGGILVALNGITGDAYSDAVLKIREARQRGRYVVVLERDDLEKVASGVSLTEVIDRKYEAMVLI